MIGRGCLVAALGVVVGLAVVGDAADIGARHLATGKVEQRIRQVVPHTSGVHGRIRAFPFLGVAVNGRVDDMGAQIDRLAPYSDVSVDLQGARVSIGNMVTALRLDVTRIRHGTVTFNLPAADLARADPAAVPTDLSPSVDGLHRMLILTPPSGRPVLVPLPPKSVVPCIPAVASGPGGLRFGCSFNTVPAAFTTGSHAA